MATNDDFGSIKHLWYLNSGNCCGEHVDVLMTEDVEGWDSAVICICNKCGQRYINGDKYTPADILHRLIDFEKLPKRM